MKIYAHFQAETLNVPLLILHPFLGFSKDLNCSFLSFSVIKFLHSGAPLPPSHSLYWTLAKRQQVLVPILNYCHSILEGEFLLTQNIKSYSSTLQTHRCHCLRVSSLLMVDQTCRKSCSAVVLLRAEQGPCELGKDFVNKLGEQQRARESLREPKGARELESEPERVRDILSGSLCLSGSL